MEITRGDIYYNKIENKYLVVTGCVYTDTIRYICMVFDISGNTRYYENDTIKTQSELENEDIYNQVGGIY